MDVLFVPVGGIGTLDDGQAAEVISQLEPSVVIPMNYSLGADGGHPEALEKVCHEMGVKEFTPQARISVTKSSLPAETQVVILGVK